jgi:hypothetical protein
MRLKCNGTKVTVGNLLIRKDGSERTPVGSPVFKLCRLKVKAYDSTLVKVEFTGRIQAFRYSVLIRCDE